MNWWRPFIAVAARSLFIYSLVASTFWIGWWALLALGFVEGDVKCGPEVWPHCMHYAFGPPALLLLFAVGFLWAVREWTSDVQTHDGQEWTFVEGTERAAPMGELAPVTPAPDATVPPTATLSDAASDAATSPLRGEEREWLRGLVSRDANYRLMVSGDVGPKELGELIRVLQAQKAMLEHDTC
jgi:hypothetical protein